MTATFDLIWRSNHSLQNTQVSESQVFRHSYSQSYVSSEQAPKNYAISILCYNGLDIHPRWVDIDAGLSCTMMIYSFSLIDVIFVDKYIIFCTVKADLTLVPQRRKRNAQGTIYYTISWEVVLYFGLTEIKAQIAWNDSEVMWFL